MRIESMLTIITLWLASEHNNIVNGFTSTTHSSRIIVRKVTSSSSQCSPLTKKRRIRRTVVFQDANNNNNDFSDDADLEIQVPRDDIVMNDNNILADTSTIIFDDEAVNKNDALSTINTVMESTTIVAAASALLEKNGEETLLLDIDDSVEMPADGKTANDIIGEAIVKDAIDKFDPDSLFDSQIIKKKKSKEGSSGITTSNIESTTTASLDIKREFLNDDDESKKVADLTINFLNNEDSTKSGRGITGESLEEEEEEEEEPMSSIFDDFVKEVKEEAVGEVTTTREFLDGSSAAEDDNHDEDDTTVTSTTTADTVEAILKVSQEAAEAAEAAMPEAVLESIPLIPLQQHDSLEMNATTAIVPAEEIVGKSPVTTKDINFPSVKRIMLFAVSATGVFLCSPLLSLIDTSAVGLLSGTAQQAALNPGVAVTDYAALLMAFLYTGATNLVAAAQAKDSGNEEKPVTTNSLKTALQLSGYVGSFLGFTLLIFARRLLRTLIGNDSINAEVFNAAMKYVQIRALGMPAAAIIGSAQAGCLGMQDTRSPLYVLGAAAFVNLIGDTLFVGMDNAWIGGAAGAAWATVFSQYAAVYFFMRWMFTTPTKPKPPRNINISDAIMELTGNDDSPQGKGRRRRFKEAIKSFTKRNNNKSTTPNSTKSLTSKLASVTSKLVKPKKSQQQAVKEVNNRSTTRGFLKGKSKFVDLLKFPKAKDAKQYAQFVLPVTTTQVGRVSSYVTMSHVVSSTMGTSAMAAQQVIVSFFYCLTPIADSLGLTAQSMIPSIAERPHSRGRARALRKSLGNFYKAGGIFGMAMVSAVLGIPFLSNFFTSDPGVATMVNSIVPLLVAFFGVHGFFMSSEGFLLGQKDLGFIGRMYALFFVGVPYFMLRVKKAALTGKKVNLTSIWKVFIIYHFIRLASFVARTFQIQRRSDLTAETAEKQMLL